ncbi:hypothetical protein C2G38_326736 [Gigaspora rosea]|uniref:Uncharacterized protein n=1 Tax=Gigaspora rosea TaxID=44941 RepID=A0A397VXS6_9GLOM|nr:hypothetical protein C2G38_326736 [Gigaspora rosea]
MMNKFYFVTIIALVVILNVSISNARGTELIYLFLLNQSFCGVSVVRKHLNLLFDLLFAIFS